MGVDVFPGGKSIQDQKRRVRIGHKIVAYLSQKVADGGGRKNIEGEGKINIQKTVDKSGSGLV